MDFECGASARELGKTRRSPDWHGTAKRGNFERGVSARELGKTRRSHNWHGQRQF